MKDDPVGLKNTKATHRIRTDDLLITSYQVIGRFNEVCSSLAVNKFTVYASGSTIKWLGIDEFATKRLYIKVIGLAHRCTANHFEIG